MYLKSLEIQGFKSFADKVTLSFLPPSDNRQQITGVVGPNGSGKSNVVDAIRWVMGEQSMKTLRGKKSEDVIFSGSEAKGKLGAASVTMVIDNSDHKVDLEYDELSVTRRMYRSGDSEYILNGAPARLIDIQLLLARAQFGQGSYSIVGQGMIDRMLLVSPIERKNFFDEASGIKELQIKYHQATLKLARTREHMAQATALLDEVEPRLKILSRQVKKLEERKTVEERLREAEEQYFATLAEEERGLMKRLSDEMAVISDDLSTRKQELQQIQEELSGLARGGSDQEHFAALSAEYQSLSQKKNNLERERAVIQGKLQAEYSSAGKENVSWLEKKISELRAGESAVEIEWAEMERKKKEFEYDLKRLEDKLSGSLGDQANLRRELLTAEERLADARHEEQMFQAIGLRAVQAIIEERHRLGTVYGAVAQLGEVDREYQLALEVAAGSHLSSLVVGDDVVAEKCIQYLREHQLGFATFLPLNKIQPRHPKDVSAWLSRRGVRGLAVELIRFDDKFRNIFAFVFGSTLIVENISVAREIGIGSVRMVTLTGDVLEENGSMRGGFRRQRQHGLSFAQRSLFSSANPEEARRHIEELRSELAARERESDVLRSDLTDKKTALEIMRREAERISERRRASAAEIATLDQERRLYSMSPEDYSETMKKLAQDKIELEKSIAALDENLAVVGKRISTYHEEEERKKQRIFSLQDAMQTKQNEVNVLSEARNDKQVELAKIETKIEDLAHEVYQELRISLESLVERGIPVVQKDALPALQDEVQKLKYKLSLIGGIDEDVLREFAETRERHDGLTAQLTDLEKASSDLETLIEELDGMMKKKRDRAFRNIRKEFVRYFQILFEGGKADLVEVYGEEMIEEVVEGEVVNEGEIPADESAEKPKRKKVLVGVDIIASPPGKKITNIQTLSGGERTLTAIALICAILRTNPSPFVILDEVEAALDEANTLRFVSILRELASASQFILITHNRATMHAADALYGVTMGSDGISHLLSVKLEK